MTLYNLISQTFQILQLADFTHLFLRVNDLKSEVAKEGELAQSVEQRASMGRIAACMGSRPASGALL